MLCKKTLEIAFEKPVYNNDFNPVKPNLQLPLLTRGARCMKITMENIISNFKICGAATKATKLLLLFIIPDKCAEKTIIFLH